MSISIGDRLPDLPIRVRHKGESNETSLSALFETGTHVLFAVPGAFTPTCSARHLPGYVESLEDFRAKGVSSVACLAVNDAFVMAAWAETGNAEEIVMIADGNAEVTRALGMEMDASAYGMGTRSRRYAMVIRDGAVSGLYLEPPGEFAISSAASVLNAL